MMGRPIWVLTLAAAVTAGVAAQQTPAPQQPPAATTA